MGTCNSKGENIIESNQNNNHNNQSFKIKQSDFDENDLKLVRSSWNQVKCLTDFRTIGANMMVK